MKCFQCGRAGYNLPVVEGKPWCGSCNQPGTRTITEARFGGTLDAGPMLRGAGSLAALPRFATLAEWSEIAALCRKVSSRKLLTEDGGSDPIKALPLPNMKNPLDERPTDKRSGWQPLSDYMKGIKENPDDLKLFGYDSKNQSRRNLFEG